MAFSPISHVILINNAIRMALAAVEDLIYNMSIPDQEVAF